MRVYQQCQRAPENFSLAEFQILWCKFRNKKKDGVPHPSLRQISVKYPSVGSDCRHSAVKISLSNTLQNFSHKSSNGLLSIS